MTQGVMEDGNHLSRGLPDQVSDENLYKNHQCKRVSPEIISAAHMEAGHDLGTQKQKGFVFELD